LDFIFFTFLISTSITLFPYILQYFFILYFLKIYKDRQRDTHTSSLLPKVSIILPVYNEEKVIKDKIRNLLELDYPKGLKEIIVVDGGSTDRTAELVKALGNEQIKLIREEKRQGVTEAVKKGVLSSEGEIILVTDAEVIFERNALKFLVEDLADPNIGAVSGVQILVNPSENLLTKMESSYREYYDVLRTVESVAHSTFHFRGEFVGVRKDLFPISIGPKRGILDHAIAFNVIRLGYRAICDERIKFFEFAPDSLKDRNKQKMQRGTLVQQTMLQNLDLLFKPKFKIFGLFCFPCNFFVYFISPITFLTSLCLFPIIVTRLLNIWPVIPILIIVITITILIEKFRALFFAFFHAQLCLIASLLRNIVLAEHIFLNQVEGTRKSFNLIDAAR